MKNVKKLKNTLMITSNNKKKNYLEYLNENYFKEKGFVQVESKLDELEIDPKLYHKTLPTKVAFRSVWDYFKT